MKFSFRRHHAVFCRPVKFQPAYGRTQALKPAIRDFRGQRYLRDLLASELPTSPHYQPDGYWRGPIWAPSTVLVVDGLRTAGHGELARRISDRFRALYEVSGFAENFDALTGAGLRDRAYTWTASAYLILARTQMLGVESW